MEDTQEDGDELLSVVVKEEYDVQEEDAQFVEVDNRMAETPLDTSLDCHECGETHKNVQCLLRHLASRHGGLVTEMSDSLSTANLHSVTSIKEELNDEVEELSDLKIPFGSAMSIKTPLPGYKKFECDKCGLKLSYKHGLIRHFKEVHLGYRKFKCKKCKKIFKRNSDLQIHLKSHSNNSLECHECGRSYSNVQSLLGHLASSHGHIVTEVSDSLSTSTLHSITSAKKDQIDQVETSPNLKITSESTESIFKILLKGSKKFECNKCGLKVMHKPNIIRHYNEVHLGMKNFKCRQCNKFFSRYYDLKIHLKTHSNKSLSVTSPKEHQKVKVEKLPYMKIPPGSEISIKTPLPRCKKIECDECGVKFAHHGSFRRHYREVHLGIRNFKCKQCEKVFSRHFDLKRHLESHSSNILSVTSSIEHQKDQVDKFTDLKIQPLDLR